MNATTPTTRTAIGRRALVTTLFALLALALSAQGGLAKPAKVAGADVINQRVKNYVQDCADMGGTSDETTVLGPNNTIASITATCTDTDGSEIWGCEVAHTNIACRTRPPTTTESVPPRVADPTLSPEGSATPGLDPGGLAMVAPVVSPSAVTPESTDEKPGSEAQAEVAPEADASVEDKP